MERKTTDKFRVPCQHVMGNLTGDGILVNVNTCSLKKPRRVCSLWLNTPTMMDFKPIPVTREKVGRDAQ